MAVVINNPFGNQTGLGGQGFADFINGVFQREDVQAYNLEQQWLKQRAMQNLVLTVVIGVIAAVIINKIVK